jgi:hypothetical protein
LPGHPSQSHFGIHAYMLWLLRDQKLREILSGGGGCITAVCSGRPRPRAAAVIPATVAFERSSLKSVLRMPEYTRVPLTGTEYKIESGIMDVARR